MLKVKDILYLPFDAFWFTFKLQMVHKWLFIRILFFEEINTQDSFFF